MFVSQSCLHLVVLCHAQVQAVTSVGGGDFSSPVTVSLREPSPDSKSGSSSNEAGVIAGAVVAVTLTLGLIVTAHCAYICWYVCFTFRTSFGLQKQLKKDGRKL